MNYSLSCSYVDLRFSLENKTKGEPSARKFRYEKVSYKGLKVGVDKLY